MTGNGLAVTIENVRRSYGDVEAVAGVSLDVKAGEFVSLLGPSGSGKTTLLMMLAGFDVPKSGSISVGDRNITNVPPNKRDIAMVFQRYALFPHMTVAENIAFPLRMRGIDKGSQRSKIERALAIVKLESYAGRRPSELSGGQQQRVALARAIVFEPPVILMDEPLGALDRKLRQHMQIELKQLQRRLGATVIYVTHDQDEALTMSDRIAVMNHGRLVQYGLPQDLYDEPASRFVADFIGESNLVDGRIAASKVGGIEAIIGGTAVPINGRRGSAVGGDVTFSIRPEHVRILEAGGSLPGTLTNKVFNGPNVTLYVRLSDGAEIRSTVEADSLLTRLNQGTPVGVDFNRDKARWFTR